MRTWTLGTDWGSYLYWDKSIQFDWAILKAGGCKFFATRGDQELISDTGNYSAVKNILAARQAGIQVCGSYYWHFPHLKQAQIIEQYKRAIEREKPDFIAVDAEQTSYYVNDDDPRHPIDKTMASATLEELCDALKAAYPELPFLLYSRLDYLLNYTPGIIPRISKYDLWLAGWLDYGLHVYEMPLDKLAAGYMRDAIIAPDVWQQVNVMQDGTPPEIAGAKTLVWQHTSRIIPTYPGKTAPAYHQYDFNFWLGDEASLLNWAKSGGYTPPTEPPTEENVASIYNQSVAQKDRAKIVKIDADQKPTAAWKDLGADAVILEMGGMPFIDGYCRPQAAPSFQNRSKEAAEVMPVLGRFELDAGAWLRGQEGAAQLGASFRDNKIMTALVTAWHNGAWSWDNVLSKQGVWNPVSALVLEITEDVGYNGDVPDLWQGKMLEEVVNKILFLQDNGMAPVIPIIAYTHNWFLFKYPVEFRAALSRLASKIYLGLGVWKFTSEGTFDNLAALFAFRPDDTFTFPLMPDGYGTRTMFHEYMYQKQKVKTIVDASGKPTLVDLALWCDTPEKMYSFLGFDGEVVPPVEPPVEPPTNTDLEDRVATLEREMDTILDILRDLGDSLANI